MGSNSLNSGVVVVIGGGFGGLTAALELSRGKSELTIILIEPRKRFVFLPLLYELLSSELEAWEVAPTYRFLLASTGIIHVQQSVENIDLDREIVVTSNGQNIHYNKLVISTGSKPDTYGIPGVKEYGLMFHKFEDVSKIKKLIQVLNSSRIETEEFQNLIIVGGGATGLEIACKINDLLVNPISIHVFEIGERVLFNGKSFNQEQIEKALKKRSIKVHFYSKVVKINSDEVEIINLKDKNLRPYVMNFMGLIWTAGVKSVIPNGLPSHLLKDGKVLINSKLNLCGYENVFAIGDIACDLDSCLPSTAQVAMQQGNYVASNLLGSFTGKSLNTFQFVDRGEMLSMGIGEATVTGLGLTISGPLAFQLRRMAYLSKFPNFSLGIRSAGAWLLSHGKKFH